MTEAEIARMSAEQRIGEAMRRSLPRLGPQAREMVEQLLQPENLVIVAAVLLAWIGSHLFGVGQVVDVILLATGILVLGLSVFEGAGQLYDFADKALNASSDGDFDAAGQHFASAVTILGIATVQAILMRAPARAVVARGRPTILPRPNVGPPPPGAGLQVIRPHSLPGGALGSTDAYGVIQVARNQLLAEQRLTLLHEMVHRFFSPRTGPLRRLRAEMNISAYSRSVLLRYVEEALAEGYAQLRINGLSHAVAALRFPLQGGYVTLSQIIIEGQAIGSITLGGAIFMVSVSQGPMTPRPP